MYNATIAALERIDSASSFERLCETLLLPLYPNLNPIGRTADRGRDATAEYFEATDPANRKVVLQFSYQSDWRSKLTLELKKVKENKLDPDRYVFVTNQSVSGQARSELEGSVPRDYGFDIEIYDQEWLRARLESPEYLGLRQQYLGLPPETIPLFLSPEQFAARAGSSALSEFDIPLVGREQELEQLSAWLSGQSPVLTLSGQGGLGKTRLTLAFAENVASAGQWRPVFVRVDAEQFESHLAELSPGQPYLVIIDDAERWKHKDQLIELLTNSQFGPIKILLVARPAFKDAVTSFASRFRVEELRLGRMPRSELDRVITGQPCFLSDTRARNAVLDLAQGHPLVAIAACNLLREGRDINGLNQDEVLGRYFDRLVEDAIGGEPGSTRDYLAMLVGLDGIALGASQLREAVRTKLGINEEEEHRIIQQLVKTGLVLELDNQLRVVPAMLANHLLLNWFFDTKEPPRYDYRRSILEPFFALAPADIIRSLATAEVLDEASAASRLLSPVLEDMVNSVGDGDNVQRLAALYAVASIAGWRPDPALLMVQQIIEGPVLTPTGYEHPIFGRWEVGHRDVLAQAIRVLDQTKYATVEESLRCLYALSRFAGTDEEYRSVRNEAARSLENFFEIDPRNDLAIYDRALTEVAHWLNQDPSWAELPVKLLSKLLEPQFSWVDRSPEHSQAIVWTETPLYPSSELSSLRERTLGMLHDLYVRTDSPALRKQIIEAHDSLAPFRQRELPEALQTLIDREVEASAAFFHARLDLGADLYERSAFRSWAVRMERFAGYRGAVLKGLVRRIERSPEFQLYVHLVDYPERRLRRSGWRAVKKQLLKFRGRVIAKVDANSIDAFIDELEAIVSSYRASGGTATFEVALLLRSLARWKPELAEHVLRRAANDPLELRNDVAAALAQLRERNPEIASGLIAEWANSEDPVLHQAILASYRGRPEPVLEDLQIVDHLIQTREPSTVRIAIRMLPRFQSVDAKQPVKLLKSIAAAADEEQLGAIAEVLATDLLDPEGDSHFLEIDSSDLDAIVQNFLPLAGLNSNGGIDIALTLQRLGQQDSRRLLAFLHKRIEQLDESATLFNSGYRALPFRFLEAFEGLDRLPEFADLLREVRGWVAESGGKITARTVESARVLKQLAQDKLDGPLRDVLEEWLDGTDEQRRTVAHILREFGDDPVFYDIAKSLIASGDDQVVLAHLSSSILSVSTGSFGSLAPAIELRRKALTGWLDDTTTPVRSRHFARQIIEQLNALLEDERKMLAAMADGN